MLEASIGRSVAVARTDETMEPGRLPTGIPVTRPPAEQDTRRNGSDRDVRSVTGKVGGSSQNLGDD